MLRWLTAGESHGPALVAILEGLPARVRVTTADIADALARRRLGYGRGARMKFEQDEVTSPAACGTGVTMGGPVAIQVGNTEWPKWEQVMSADPVDPVELDALARNAALTRPRPGPRRPGRACRSTTSTRPGRSSSGPRPARPPPGSRWAGSPRPSSSRRPGPGCVSHVVELGGVPRAGTARCRVPDDVARLDADPVRCLDADASKRWSSEIDAGAQATATPSAASSRCVVLRPAAGPRLARALGPPARRPARRRADGHPGDQGRRGRRRVRARRHAAARWPTTRSCDRGRRHRGVRRDAPAAPRAA